MNTKMKIYVQIIDDKTNVYQQATIDEPVSNNFKVANALEHLGVKESWVNWDVNVNILNNCFMCGRVKDTTKVVIVYFNKS